MTGMRGHESKISYNLPGNIGGQHRYALDVPRLLVHLFIFGEPAKVLLLCAVASK